MDAVLPITAEDVVAAKELVLARRDLSSRDALHVAVMRRHEIRCILTFDRGFDAIEDLERLAP